jgi:ornithine--oxo-acid transaminase
MRAGLATLEVLQNERLGDRATRLGQQLRQMLAARLAGYEMISEIRGIGMLTGIEFRAPKRLRLRIPFGAFARIHPAMFGQVVVMHLFRDKGILTQICGNDFMVLKIAPPADRHRRPAVTVCWRPRRRRRDDALGRPILVGRAWAWPAA